MKKLVMPDETSVTLPPAPSTGTRHVLLSQRERFVTVKIFES